MLRTLSILLLTTSVAFADPVRVRGTVAAVDASSLTLHTQDGTDVKLALDPAAKFASVTPADASAIKPGTFIGTATKGAGSKLTSLEVVVFPESLRGTGEGHYDWDKLPDPAGGSAVATSMTNGTVAASPPRVATKMTNGNIDAASASGGTLHLTISYKGGQKNIIVPADTPVVTLQPADRSVLKQGAHVFAVTRQDAGGLTALRVLVGVGGVVPPM